MISKEDIQLLKENFGKDPIKYELVTYNRHSRILISILRNNTGIGSIEFSSSEENGEKENSIELIKLLENMINGWNRIEETRSY